MAQAQLSNVTERIGKVKGEVLAHALPVEVLSLGMGMKKMPKNSSDTIIYRRWLPYGASAGVPAQNKWTVTAAAHVLTEGTTPTPDSLTPQDVTVSIEQYGCLYSYTDKFAALHEDGTEVPAEMKKQTGHRLGLVREMLRYGALQACTNKFYSGGTSRATVDEKITLNVLRKATRSLKVNHAETVTSILAPSPNYQTRAVEAAFIVFVHTDAEADLRDLAGFKVVAEYGQRKPISEYEIGSCENFRFILSPELAAVADAGALVGSTGLFATSTNIDVYPFIVMGEDAAFDLALRGSESLDVSVIPPSTKDKNDPLGQRGYIGAKFYSAAFVANDGWMAVIEAGVTAL